MRITHAWLMVGLMVFVGCGDDDGTLDASTGDGGSVGHDGGDIVDLCTGVDCTAMDTVCNVGVCVDGTCEAQRAADGATCDDGDPCTAMDACTAGACGGSVRDCSSFDSPCAVGVCDPMEGCVAEPANRRVDVLFMIDNSNSMAEEQESLAEQLPRLTAALATGDLDGDGTPDTTPVRELHLGVVTADMGTAGFVVPSCPESMLGDDGVLRTQGNTSRTGCVETYPSFLEFIPTSGADPLAAAAEFACVANAGTGGCGFEQQLEATLKAVTPATAATRFVGDSTGHADNANAGFLRPDSVLVVFLLTDEDDCSARDGDLYNPGSTAYAGDLNLRCHQYPAALHPVARYVDGLEATRTNPSDLIFVAVSGIPVDLVSSGTIPDFTAILADSRMIEMIDPMAPARLAPSCNVAGRGFAFPPRRIVATAQGLAADGVTTILDSICQADLSASVDAVLTRVAMTCATP